MWLYVSVDAIRKAGLAKDLFKGKARDPAAEVVLGGLLSNLQKTPFATIALSVNKRSARLSLGVPHSSQWIPESRTYYFGAEGKGQAPPLVEVKDMLLTLSTYRDLGDWWLRSGDLYNEAVNDQIAAAESTLTTLFSGRDFGRDILGSMYPQIQLVVTRQSFAQARTVPAIKVPAFAMTFRLKNHKRMQGELRRIFQSLVGFFNVAGAMNGQPQLDQSMENKNGVQIVSAFYVPEEGKETTKTAPLNFNFSPHRRLLQRSLCAIEHQATCRRYPESRQGRGGNGEERQIDSPILHYESTCRALRKSWLTTGSS